MADLFTLLTLPQTSTAFSKLSVQPQHAPSATSTRDSSRSASPPRKIARLDYASDTHSASASSSRVAIVQPLDKRGAIILQVVGHSIKPTAATAIDADYALVRRSVKALLDPDNKNENPDLPATYERISRACRAVVAEAGRGEGLYDVVKMELERCVGIIERQIANAPEKSIQWLVPFTASCAWFERRVSLLQSLLAYLDTLYVAETTNLTRIKPLAYTMFTATVIKSARVTQAVMDGLADWLEDERTNRHEHKLRTHLPHVVRHLRAYNLYSDLIELSYLNLTQTFYAKESSELVARGDVPADDFLNKMDQRIKEEEARAQVVLVENSIDAVKDTTRSALLTGQLQWLAKDAIQSLFEKKDREGLKRMYDNFAKVGGLKVLHAAFKTYVHYKVKEIVTDTEHDEEMVNRLLKFKAFADSLVANAFVDRDSTAVPSTSTQPLASSSASNSASPQTPVIPNRDFAYGLIDAFQAGFRARRNKPAEMIAKHIDKSMRRGQKGQRDEDFEAELEQVLALYRFTDDMDVFRTFYQRALAKRLLLGRSASDDFEKAILKKLKEKYDPEFGMSDHMFKDLTLSRELMTGFLEGEERHSDTSQLQKLNVMVLQRSAWPFAARKSDVDLPRWMQDDLTTYLAYYHQKFQGRKLDWDHALGTATLKARFKAGEKELSVSLYQAVILLLFNESDPLTYADIKEQIRLDDGELQRTLQSLACGKKRVLRKSPLGKDVNKTDTFHFNADFTDTRYQVHINSIQAKETPEETKRTQSSIEQDRKHALDAAIVRVMKGKKELTYEQLKTATIEAVKRHFVPDVVMIKKRIEGLVEQDYLRRDEEDLNKYFYVA